MELVEHPWLDLLFGDKVLYNTDRVLKVRVDLLLCEADVVRPCGVAVHMCVVLCGV